MSKTSKRPSRPSGGSGRAAPSRPGAAPAKQRGTVPARPPVASPVAPPAPIVGDTTLRWSIRLLAVEAAIVAALTIGSIWIGFTSSRVSVGSAIATPVFLLVCALILGGLGYALSRWRSFARGPAIVLQMLLVPMGWYMIRGNFEVGGIVALVFGLAGTILLLAPSTRLALLAGPPTRPAGER